MTKNEYMKVLSHKLRRLPKDDYYKAIEYFEEYFAEAGPEHEEEAIEDLGSPQDAAKALIVDLAAQNAKEPPKTFKKGISAVWIAILAVFAAPIAIPLAISIVIVIGALVISLGIVILSLIFSAVGIAAAGVFSIIGGIILMFQSFADGLCCLGLGLFSTGIGILFVYGSILFFKWVIRKISVSLSRLTKGGHKNETTH
nr:DUF1700 domain-containing protein [uncultured Mediterraneibacter sp.]